LDGKEWSFDNLNSLSWAIGLISGIISIEEEKSFLIYVIRVLLNLCEQKKGKENKAVVASNIMYVVGQYPRFLKTNWNFLKTVVKKLFEFMHEDYKGIMEMAINTFLKIAKTCKEEFVIIHTKQNDFQQHQIETAPYINELISKIPEETKLLVPEHKITFYEAIGHIISAEINIDQKECLLQGILQEYWDYWDTMLKESDINFEVLGIEKNIESFQFIIKVHERLAFSIGDDFSSTMTRIFPDLLKLYIFYSRLLPNEIRANSKIALDHHLLSKILALQKEIITLIITFIEKSNKNNMNENFITPLMEILQDYCFNSPNARNPQVLNLFTIIVEKFKGNIAYLVPKILENACTILNSAREDFTSNIDYKVNLLKLILEIIKNCFQVLISIPAEQFKIVLECILWAIRHEMSSIFNSGLESLLILLKNLNVDQNIANQFYQLYFMHLLQNIIFVITDGLHKSGFKQQTQILASLFQIIATDYITIPLTNGQNTNNKEFVYEYIVEELSKNFQTLTKNQTSQYIAQLFNLSSDIEEFKIVLTDYLIRLSRYDLKAV